MKINVDASTVFLHLAGGFAAVCVGFASLMVGWASLNHWELTAGSNKALRVNVLTNEVVICDAVNGCRAIGSN